MLCSTTQLLVVRSYLEEGSIGAGNVVAMVAIQNKCKNDLQIF